MVTKLNVASGTASVFCVKETTDDNAQAYVAKAVTLTGLDAKQRASAQQEVSLLKGLAAHAHLIAFRDSFMDESGILFMVMSLAEDGDLRTVVTESQAAKRTIPEPVIFTWIRQTLSGLDHLHSQGVLHRDLKSSNIFLCEGRRRIRIGDFGISRVLESTCFASSCVGTPAYMSPELMRNERYNYHVDMWALGCICFELCTLNLPFSARSLVELAQKVIQAEPAWTLWDGFSDLRNITHRLLDKDVAVRPSASALLAEPLFSFGGRATVVPSEEDWLVLRSRPTASGGSRSPEKRIPQVPMSQLTTAVTKESLSSSDGVWTTTPRMAWETMSRGTSSLSGASPGSESLRGGSSSRGRAPTAAPELQKALDGHGTLSKDDLADILSTQTDQLLSELRNGGSQSYRERLLRDEPSQVAETVI